MKQSVVGKITPTFISFIAASFDHSHVCSCRRIDRQVKVNGVRIELGEVETAMESLKDVKKAIAIGRKDMFPGRNVLVGYVTPEYIDPDSVKAGCRATLVPSMVPSYIVPLAEFKLLPNGKVDQKSLPKPEIVEKSHKGQSAFETPGNATEELLLQIWMDVLGLEDPPSVHDDFFALGGTSLQVQSYYQFFVLSAIFDFNLRHCRWDL